MAAKQNSKVRWGRAVAHVGIAGAYLALVAACSGSIEETDVDRTRAERASNNPAPAATGTPAAPAAPRPVTSAPTGNAPATTTPPAASTPPASTPPASTPPASTPPAAEDEDPPPAAGGGDVSFEADVYPILSTKCAPCHNGSLATAGVTIADEDVAGAFDSAKEKEARLIARTEAGGMPPGCNGPPGSSGCISQAEFDTIEAWSEAGTPE